jgi:Uma2 family endonuclease
VSVDLTPNTIFTEEDYYQIEARASMRHEFVGHKVIAMAPGLPPHADLCANVGIALGGQLRGRPCKVRIGNQRLMVPGLITYPDVLVICPPAVTAEKDPYTLLEATVIVEVFSPVTAVYDRIGKFDLYQPLREFRDYILIDQERVHVEHRHRGSQDSPWGIAEYTSLTDVVRLDSIGCILPLEEIYSGIALTAESPVASVVRS